MLASLTSFTSRLDFRLPSFKGRGKFVYLGALVVIVAATAAFAWYRLVYIPSQTQQASVLQTATVLQGDLTISATGTGTLTAPQETLGFTAGGEMQVTGVYVRTGDLVQAGDLLAAVDSQQAQTSYDNAKQKYLDLTSTSAVAAAARSVADAETKLQSAKLQLEYLISPDVVYWEGEEEKAVTALKKAQDRLYDSPTDAAANKNFQDAEDILIYMQGQLAVAHTNYLKVYVPATFPIAIDGDTDTYMIPTELELKQARLAIGEAEAAVKDSKELYAVLTGDPMPDSTDNDSLIAIQKAKSNLDKAQAVLDGTRILAPFSGTIMQVNAAGGNTAEINPKDSSAIDASKVIVIADTDHPYLEVFWDASDWSLVKVGTSVEITFDDSPDQVYTGKITEVDSSLYSSGNSSVVRGDVSLDISYADLALPVGASASVEAVSQRAQNAIYIPVEALHDIGSGQYAVFVLTNGTPKVRIVQVGLQNSLYAEITSGLQPGDIVTTGLVKTK